MIRIATWNVNSIRIRQGILAQCVGEHKPDVLCLQETKVQDEHFPHDMVKALGYEHTAIVGQKSYNGVAILSKIPLSHIEAIDVLGNGEKRHISARLPNGTTIHNLYVPAGGDIPDTTLNPKFADKLRYVQWMEEWAKKTIQPDGPTILVGDLNIAPLEHDVWSHKQLRDVVSHTAVEIEALTRAQHAAGWIDVARHFVPATEKLYSWWSYRNRDWAASNRGRRLDHIWTTPVLKSKLSAFHIVRDARGWEATSDHVPVMMDIAL